MFRSYLGYVETTKMISRRLSKIQKAEILEAYRAGDNTNFLAEKYSCSTNTINRTVKTLLSDSEYKLLKEKRLKVRNKKEKNEDLDYSISLVSLSEEIKSEDLIIESVEELSHPKSEKIASLDLDLASDFVEKLPSESQFDKKNDVDENNHIIEEKFELIAPLLSSFDFDKDKKIVDFQLLNYESLPESVYMIVDKKVELDLQLIYDLPEWSFLPENELERNAILLFSNQRSAKRSCSRNQRVIKIPNTSIFKLSKSYLISKGITRLILEDSIIALDK